MVNFSLKTRMAVAVTLLFVTFSAISAYFSIAYMEDRFKQSLADRQYSLACAIANDIDDKLLLLQKALQAASLQVSAGIAADPEKAQRFLDERVTLHSLFDTTLFLLSKDGRIVAESPFFADRRGVNLAYREYFQKTLSTGKPVISSPYISSMSHRQPVVMLTAPVFDRNGNLTSILCCGLKPLGKNLLGDLQQIKIGATGYLFLATSDRTLILHPDKSRIMKIASPPGVNRFFDKAIGGFDGSGETINSQGTAMLSSSKHLRATDWILTVNTPLSEAYAPMYTSRQYLLAGISAGTFAMLGIAWLVMRILTAPLVSVTREVEAMSTETGDLRLLSYSSSDEIGTLAKAFNGMVAAVEKKQADLKEREDTFRALAETASDGIMVIRGSGSFAYSNYHAAKILGYSVNELLKCGISDLAHPDELPQVMERFHKIISWKKVPKRYETRMVCKDGSVIPVEVSSSLTVWREESADLVIFRDISDRRRIEKALQESYALLQKTFASLNETVFVVQSGTGVVQDCNATAANMFGYSRGELIGSTTSCLHVNTKDFDWFGSEALKSCEDKGYFETVFQMKRKDGTIFDSEHYVSPIAEEGEIVGYVSVVRDISDRKRAEENIRAAMIRAENEKARTEAIIAAIGEGIIIQDREYRIVYQNEVHKALLGEHPGEFCYQVYFGNEAVCEECPVEMAFGDGRVHSVEKTLLLNGRTVNLEVTASPLRDASGEIIAGIELVRNISERKLSEKRVKESEARFRAIFEGARDAIFLADVDTGIILDANPQAEKLLGRPKREIICRHQTELHPPENLEYSRQSFAEHVKGGAVPVCNEIVTVSGGRIPVEINASIIQLTDGRNVIIGIFRDIAERKRAEAEIRNLNEELQQHVEELAAANRDMEAFGYSLSHDLRAPLTSIYCAAQGLTDLYADQLDETGNFFLDGICKASERMEEVINAMSLLSRVSRSELQLEQIDVTELVTQILLRLRMEDRKRKARAVVSPGVKVTADLPLLKSALENLLGNAWKYTRNTPEAHIEFGIFRQGGEEVYFVRDNGAGFDMTRADRLFKPFQRLHAASEYEGTGIGLATVQRIIHRHGGKLWGEGEPGKGATFYFTLPGETLSPPVSQASLPAQEL